ncbi:hypothetical protein WSK_0602 [Novosphingobium sp. Rr 2-17]|nr:hypothetical protein WSK_0602 [Novosphingobium sp. Rr 2-17]
MADDLSHLVGCASNRNSMIVPNIDTLLNDFALAFSAASYNLSRAL